jgi:hypothetical protein
MVRIHIHGIVSLAGLLLLACGCTSSLRAPRTPGTGQEQTASRPSLEQEGFTVIYFRAIGNEFGGISVVGEIKNTGFAARGVELQAALRDANGRLVAVGHFCPASYRNIEPGETWPFSYSFGRQEGIARAELRIVGAFRTADILDVASANFAR